MSIIEPPHSVDYYEDDEDFSCPVCGKREDECDCTPADYEEAAYNRGYDPKDDLTEP